MTPVEQAAIKEYPDFQGPCDKPNMMMKISLWKPMQTN